MIILAKKRKSGGQIKYSFGSYGQDAFWNTRFDLLYKNLNDENKKKFKAMSLKRKQFVVGRLIEKGKMI